MFGIPVAALELVFVVMAIALGSKPLGSLLAQPSSIKIPLVSLVLICLVTAATAAAKPLVAAAWLTVMIIHLLFGIAVAQTTSLLSDKQIATAWGMIALGACAYVTLLIVFYLLLPDPEDFDWEHIRLGTNNIRHTGHYAVVGASAALGLSISRRGKALVGLLVAAGVCMSLLFWIGSRGGILAVWGGVVLASLFVPGFRSTTAWRQLAGITLASLVLAWLLPVPHALLGVARMSSSLEHKDLNSLSSFRLDLWNDASQLIAGRPLFGYGPGQFWWLLASNPNDVMHPHNVILQSLLQWGVFGTAIFGFLMFLVLRRVWRRRHTFGSAAYPPILVAACLAVMSLYDGSLFFTYPTAMFAFALGCLLGLQPWAGMATRPEISSYD